MTTPTVPPHADPLAQLRGLHLPDTIGWWPPAPGWWMLAALVAGAIVITMIMMRARRHGVRRHALGELRALEQRWARDGDLHALAIALSELVRRVALMRFGNARVASLHGTQWTGFLASTARRSGRAPGGFANGAGHLLAVAPYAPAGSDVIARAVDRGALISAARSWIRRNT